MTKQEKRAKFEELLRDRNLVKYHEELTSSYYSGAHPELKFIIDMPIEDQYIWLKNAMDEYDCGIDDNFDVLSVTYPCPWMLVQKTLQRRKEKRNRLKLQKECPLNGKAVMDIFMDCLFKEHPQPGTKFIGVEGIREKVGFDPEKISFHKDEISNMLKYLPDEFNEESGGGYSLINAPFTKTGVQWGEQIDADRLMMLGMAIGKVTYVLPRNMWAMLPGGVPYYCILKETKEPKIMTL